MHFYPFRRRLCPRKAATAQHDVHAAGCRKMVCKRRTPSAVLPCPHFASRTTRKRNPFVSCSFPMYLARFQTHFAAFSIVLSRKRGYPTPRKAILHHILHPKSPVNTGILGYGCRKCRIFFQNIFQRERRDNGLGVAKHRTSLGKSTDVLAHLQKPVFSQISLRV